METVYEDYDANKPEIICGDVNVQITISHFFLFTDITNEPTP